MPRIIFSLILLGATLVVCLVLGQNHATFEQWLTGLFTYFIAVAAILALFQDWVRSLIWRPELSLTIESKPPDCHKTSAYYETVENLAIGQQERRLHEAPCYFLRVRIHNHGRQAARDVEVYAATVERNGGTDGWTAVDRFIPQNLTWSLQGERAYLPFLPPQTFRHCDLGHVLRPLERERYFPPIARDPAVSTGDTLFSLNVSVTALRRGHLLPKGEYRIRLEVAASNAEPRSFTVVVNHAGAWYDNEVEMLSKGVTARVDGDTPSQGGLPWWWGL